MLSPKEVENLAELSRLALSDEEKKGITKDLESILGYVSELQQVATDDIGDVSETHLDFNVMREDGEPHGGNLYTEQILSQTPDRQDNFLKVKKILGTNDVA